MPLPASGSISMSMFNTILGRVATASNSMLANGSVPVSGSLLWLANQASSGSINLTSPHSLSEWYNYGISYTVSLYAQLPIAPNTIPLLYYKIDEGAWSAPIDLDIGIGTCDLMHTFSAPSGSTVYVGVRDDSGVSDIAFNASLNDCPSNDLTYCIYSRVINGTEEIYVTVHVTGGGLFAAC